MAMGVPVRPLPPNRVPTSYAQDQNTPLHAACFRGDYNEALMLLLRGADIHALNTWRETPLHQVRGWRCEGVERRGGVMAVRVERRGCEGCVMAVRVWVGIITYFFFFFFFFIKQIYAYSKGNRK